MQRKSTTILNSKNRWSHLVLFLFLWSLSTLLSANVMAQALPFAALAGDPLQYSVQVEHLGPTLWTEREHEEVVQTRFDAFLPLFEQEGKPALALQFRGNRLRLDRDRTASGASIPAELGSFSIGPFLRQKLESGDVLAGDVQIGRSGVQLGSTETATTVASTVFWARPRAEDKSQWIYILSYSNSRSAFNNVPLPGFAYLKTIDSENMKGLWAAGAPFLFALVRSQPWSGSILLTPFTGFVEVSHAIVGPFGVFTRFSWQPQAFKVNGGPAERVLYEEFRSQLGLRGPVAKWALATLGVAYSDGRRLIWGDSVFKPSVDESRLDDELSLFFNLSARF